MSRDARKKQKQRLKREQKRLQAKRARAATPLDHIKRSGGQLECYVNANWREMGMANIQVLGQTPGGRAAYAAGGWNVACSLFESRPPRRHPYHSFIAVTRTEFLGGLR